MAVDRLGGATSRQRLTPRRRHRKNCAAGNRQRTWLGGSVTWDEPNLPIWFMRPQLAPKTTSTGHSTTTGPPATGTLLCAPQIAMNDALLVRRLRSLRDLPGDGQYLIERDRATGDPLGQILALDELHDEDVQARELLERVNRGDVRMIQGRERLRLSLEPRQAVGVRRERGRQDLDRDLAAERRVGRSVDLPHPAFADRRGDFVDAEAGTGDKRPS